MTSSDQLFVSWLAKRADFMNMSDRAAGNGGWGGVAGTLANEGSYLVPFVGSGRMIADGVSDFSKGKIWGGLGNTIGGAVSGAMDVFGGSGSLVRGALRGGRLARLATKVPGMVHGIEGARGLAGGLHGFESGMTRMMPKGTKWLASGMGRSLAQSPGRPMMTPLGNVNLSPLVSQQRRLDAERGFGNDMASRMQNLPSQLSGWSNPMGREMNPAFIRPAEGGLPFGMNALGSGM